MRYEGDIYRPPGEWRSYLLQATIGCSHNACTFCGMYKDKRYRVRPLADILEDIDMAKEYYGDLTRVFICDGDAIAMPTEDLLQILHKLHSSFSSLERVTIYASPNGTLGKTPEELKALHEAGLGRAYLGVETGDDALLKAVNKGVDAAGMLKAGQMLVESGIDLWTIVLMGLAGTGESKTNHVPATVKMINAMKPQHISAMTYNPTPGTKLYRDIQEGRFQTMSAEEALLETKMLVEGLTVQGIHFTSNHASNYLPLKGTLPDDREKFLRMLDGALAGEVRIRKDRMRGI
ncbi:MAG: radical SAM protein [Oscillospiraceae bacterium]|nr:radical SAM protein [Oscillospiraceae bacterium]